LPSNIVPSELDVLRQENAHLIARISHIESYNRLVLDSAVDYAVITADASGRVTDWSEGAHRILGWAKEEMLGSSLHKFFTPEDCENGIPEREIGSAVSQGRANDDRWHLRSNGERFWASGVMMPMLQDGNLVGVVKILRDLTGQVEVDKQRQLFAKQLETQFQEIAESIPQLVWISDAGGNDLYFNPKWLEFSGRTSDQLLDHAWHAFIPPETRERIASHRADAIEQQSPWEDNFQMRDRHGKESWFLCRALPIRNEAGDVIKWFSTCTDVDVMQLKSDHYEQDASNLKADAAIKDAELLSSNVELKKASTGRAAAEDQVRQLQKMEAVGQLTGGIAHDFNNMLTIIIGGLYLLKSRLERGENDVEKFIELALDGTSRAAQLTHRLLAFARQQPLSPEPVDLNRLVSGMSDLLQRTLGSNIKLEFVRHAGLWPTLADFSSLEQSILNLCVNARDAMNEGGRITVETGNVYVDDNYAEQELITPGQYVMVAVTDTGTGISDEVMARVFEPYFTTKEVGKGTGLGLAQVYGFAKQSKGHLKLYSEVGHGTSVKLYIPRYFGVAQPVERIVVKEHEVPRAKFGERVLVVEDDPIVRLISVESLMELGYAVLEADSGKAALQILKTHSDVSLLFTDVVMPEMTGKQLADEVSTRWSSLPVLYTTGYTRNAIVHNETLDKGVVLLPKPFTLRDLALKVRQVLDR
jgi:PAS domain S-box-containing protein